MPTAPFDEIVRMLVKAELVGEAGLEGVKSRIPPFRYYVYGEGGLLVWKGVSPEFVGVGRGRVISSREITSRSLLGSTFGGSDMEYNSLKGIGRPGQVLDINNRETTVLLRERENDYRYIYRSQAWHRPVLPGVFQGFSSASVGEGLYWQAMWVVPLEKDRVPHSLLRRTRMSGLIWGFVPLDEILGIFKGGVALARRCFVVGSTGGDYGEPTDSNPERYVPLGEFLRSIGAM